MKQSISKEKAEELFSQYSNYVYRTAILLTRSHSLADDVTQETFIRVYEKYHLYDEARPIEPWLYQITRNIIRRMLYKQRWLSFLPTLPEKIDKVNPSMEVFKTEEQQELWKAIDNLTFKSKEVIVLHFYLEMTLKEISEVLDIPLGTCKSRLHTGLQQLRKKVYSSYFTVIKEDII